MNGAEALDDAVHEYGHHDRDEMRARRGDADLARAEVARLRAIEAAARKEVEANYDGNDEEWAAAAAELSAALDGGEGTT